MFFNRLVVFRSFILFNKYLLSAFHLTGESHFPHAVYILLGAGGRQ